MMGRGVMDGVAWAYSVMLCLGVGIAARSEAGGRVGIGGIGGGREGLWPMCGIGRGRTSPKMIPRDHMSTALPYLVDPSRISGARYHRVECNRLAR